MKTPLKNSIARRGVNRVGSAGAVGWKRTSVVGFTLIELMLIISIIAVLAAILLPTLVIAKEKARRIACLMNLKQNGIALLIYSHDFNSAAPPFNYNARQLAYADHSYIGENWQGTGILWEQTYLSSPASLYCSSNEYSQWSNDQNGYEQAAPDPGTELMTGYTYRSPTDYQWENSTPAVTWARMEWRNADCAVLADAFGTRENHDAHSNGINILFGDNHATWAVLPLEQQIQELDNIATHAACDNSSMEQGWVFLDNMN